MSLALTESVSGSEAEAEAKGSPMEEVEYSCLSFATL